MNIIEASKLLTPGKRLVGEHGLSVVVQRNGAVLCGATKDSKSTEYVWFFVRDILSEKWTVVDE